MEFKPITTQEEFDKAIQERLNRQKETLEKQYEDYETIKAKNQELETEVSTLKTALAESNEKAGKYDKDISDLNAKIAGYETANMRTKIALQHGIPYELASRLVGEDEESITADAKKLAELVGHKEPIAPLKDVEPTIDGKDGAYKSLLENLNLEGE
jgi:septal ring factor EnvC (AmiA/AmiB activator)